MRMLVTAGPTREHLDDVRFLSNASTGAMGIAVAVAATRRGHSVVLVLGPTHLEPPKGIETERVVSAKQMYEVVHHHYVGADAVVMTAAVCDYRPEVRVAGKMKKTSDDMTLKLAANPDILASLGRVKARRVLVGFALEPVRQGAREHAMEKMRKKNLDFIVLDNPEAMAAERVSAVILSADGAEEELTDAPKRRIAERIIDLIEQKAKRD